MRLLTSSTCRRKVRTYRSVDHDKFEFLSTLAIALFPKCYLCFTAYSGAIAMCSGKNLFAKMDFTGYAIFTLLSLIILASILLKHRGKRTFFALALSSFALVAISVSIHIGLGFLYYAGIVSLCLGIWVNGSFYFVVRKIREKFIQFKLQTNKA